MNRRNAVTIISVLVALNVFLAMDGWATSKEAVAFNWASAVFCAALLLDTIIGQ